MKGTPPAVSKRVAGRLRPLALAAAAAPPLAASGSDSSSLLTHNEPMREPAEYFANAAAVADLPTRASSPPRAEAISQQRRDHVFSSVSAGRGAAADLGQGALSCFRSPPQGFHGVRMTGTVTQKTVMAISRSASVADSPRNGSAGTPACRHSVSPVVYSNLLRPPLALHPGRTNTERLAVSVSPTAAAGQTIAPLGDALAARPRSTSPYTGSTPAAGFAQPCTATPGFSPAIPSSATVAQWASTAAAEPPGEAAAADVDAPSQSCPSTLPARRSACSTTNPAAAAGGVPASATAAAHSVSGTASVAGGGVPGALPQRESHGYKATSVLLRETLPAPTETVQQSELLSRSQAAAAESRSFANVVQDSMQSVSRGNRDAAAVSAPGTTSRLAVPCTAAGAGASRSANVAASPAVAAGECIGASRGGVRARELPQRVKSPSVNTAGVVQASSFAPTAARRTALHEQAGGLRNPTTLAHSFVTAGHISRALSKTGAAGNNSGAASAAAIRNAAGADPGTAASGVVAASISEAGSRGNPPALGSPAVATVRSTCASRVTAAVPSAAGFLQRTKRVPRENHRPRRIVPYDLTFHPNDLPPSIPPRSVGFDSHFVSLSSSVSPASAACVSSAATASGAPLARPPSRAASVSGAVPVSAAAASETQQAEARAVGIGPSLHFRSEAARSDAAFRTPQQPQRPPWRALTPQQLLQQRASKMRLHAGNGNNLQLFSGSPKAPSATAASLKESCCTSAFNACSKPVGKTADAEATQTIVIAPVADAGVQRASAETEQRPISATAAVEKPPPVPGEAASPTGLPPRAVAAAGTALRSTAQETAGGGAEAAGSRTAAGAVIASRAPPSNVDSCHRSAAEALASAAGTADVCKSEARRTRKPSRLSLEAAETYSLTIAFRQQRRTSGRNTKDNPATHVEAATSSSPTNRCRNSDTRGCPLNSSCSAAATEEVQRQTVQQPAARAKRIRAESSSKRTPVQRQQHQRQQRQRQRQQQCRQQPEEEQWADLTSSQRQQAEMYAAALQRQPVFLESCSFTLYPPGFASSPAAVRRVRLSGTLQQPVYVPSAASIPSVQQTVERQQQEVAAATNKCHAKVCPVAVDTQLSGAAYNGDSGFAIASGRCIEKGRNKRVDSSSVDRNDAGMCKAASAGEWSGGSVVGFIENTTVSGYLYHWYARMHVSAQLEAQLQQLLAARDRLAQQLCDGSELHSNLFFFSLFPQDYGVEQFRHNLRFFPQYAVAAAAAEAAGLQPLELYGDNSCTAAIAETARRAKLVEQLYEEEQLLRQHRRVPEVTAPSHEQQQFEQLQQRQQHLVREKTVPPVEAQPQEAGSPKVSGTLPSASAAANPRQQGALRRTPAKKTESINQVAFAEVPAGDALFFWNKASSVPEQRAPRDVEESKEDESASQADSGAAARIDLQAAADAEGVVANIIVGAPGCYTAAASRARALHLPPPASCAAAAAEDGGSKNNASTSEATPNQTTGNSTPDSSTGTAVCATQKPSYFTSTRIPRADVDCVAPGVLTSKEQHLQVNARKCGQHIDGIDEHEKQNESLQQDAAAATEGSAKVASQCVSIKRAAVPATADSPRAAASELRRLGACTEEDTCIPSRSNILPTSLGKDGVQTTAALAVKSDLNGSSCGSVGTTRCDCDSESEPVATSMNNLESCGGVTLLNGCCASRRTTVKTTFGSTVTDLRSESNHNKCSRRSSTCDNSSCGSGSNRCASSNSSPNSSCNRKSKCNEGDSNEKSSDIKGWTFEGGLQSCSSRCSDCRSKVVARSGIGAESGSLSSNNKSTTTSSKSSNGCGSDFGRYHDNARVERSVDNSGGSAAASARSTPTANSINVSSRRTSDSVCISASPVPAKAASPPLCEGSSTRRDGGDCCGGERSSDGRRKTGVAEARYIPFIPRVGTVEIATLWRLIQASEQLLIELHQREEQDRMPQQLEEQLPALVKTLPVWWMGSVDLGMQQQLTALTLKRVLPGLAAWQGRDLRLVGSVLPFAARGLLALSLCQLEHRIAMLQQQLAAAVGGLQVLMASVLLLQQVEEHYAPPLYSLPQHVLACLYSRGGGRAVVSSSARKRPAARERTVEFDHVADATAIPAVNGSVAAPSVERDVPSADSHEAREEERADKLARQEDAEQSKQHTTTSPSWEAGVGQVPPVALEGFLSYADAFEDYLPTLGREKASVIPIFGSGTEDSLGAPVAACRIPRIGQRRSRTRAAIRSANKIKNAVESGTAKGRKKKFAGKRGESCTKDRNRKSGHNCRKRVAAKLQGRSAK